MIVVFHVDGLRCSLPAAGVREILPALAVRPQPGRPPFVAGTIDLRGTPVPVLDVRVRFGRAARPMCLSDRLTLARAHDRPLALWVDDVEDLTACAPADRVATGALVVGDRSLVGVATSAGGLTAIRDLEASVTACESDALARTISS